MSNNNPINKLQGTNKYKIYLKEDLDRKPVKYMGKKMIFRTKFAMMEFFKELSKDRLLDFEWSEI